MQVGIIIDLLLNLFLSALNFTIEMGHQLTQGLQYRLVINAFEPIDLLLSGIVEVLEMTR